MKERQLKKEIIALLKGDDLQAALAALEDFEPQGLLNPLFSGICHSEPVLHWHAVKAMGRTVTRLAEQEMEAARVVMRRFMWCLNDESGGIGWGVPEAMGEVLANHAGLAEEYTHILVSFMREDGFYLEYPPLQRGLMWGVGRLAEVRPALLHEKNVALYLPVYLDSGDSGVRGLAAWACGHLGLGEVAGRLAELADDPGAVWIFRNSRLEETSVAALAQAASVAVSS